jgi:hypothetical protein
MIEKKDLQIFQKQVADEVGLLQGRLPEWHRAGLYADHLRPLDPLERREAERLDRLLRQKRAASGERTRERTRREQAHPWTENERWTLRKRVWRERRDRERELLEQREQELLDLEQELAGLRDQIAGWLADLRQLEPEMWDWCAEQLRLSDDMGITPTLIDQIHQRRIQAAERHAIQLLNRADVRAVIDAALGAAGRDPIPLARAIAPALAVFDPGTSALQQPVVIAALALLSLRASER